MSNDRLKNWLRHPNTLTLGRLAACPLIVVLMLFPNPLCTFLAAILFAAAAITDFFDGFLARSRGMVSNFGKIMDPLADKVLVSSAFIMLASLGWVPAWMVCVIIGRELAVTGLRNFVVVDGQDVSSSSLGKYKTGFQIAAIIPLLAHYTYLGIDFNAVGGPFLWGALVMTVWSGADYFYRYRELLKF
ncbi:MAG: CDP-diacylglycerol--glycerol-3-phosphate 3-phosphatidyltransferase [Pseudomonadota bacterium]